MNLETLYKEYKDLVYNVSLGYVQNIEDAEEITQDVFVSAYQNMDNFRQDAKVSTWLYRIAINKSLDFLKAKKAKKRFAYISSIFKEGTVGLEHDKGHFNHPGVQMENKESLRFIFSQINILPENQKTVLLLTKVEGLSMKEVSEIMVLGVKAVESLLYRAKNNLKNNLEKNKG